MQATTEEASMSRRAGHIGSAFVACLLACLALAPHSLAAFGDEFGFADAEGPALAGHEKAIWFGTCDVAANSTGGNGVGTAPPGAQYCIDQGIANPGAGDTWAPGGEPAWRLESVTQAGSHPDTSVMFMMRRSQTIPLVPDGELKTVIARLPRGVAADPNAVAKCSSAQINVFPNQCPPQSQIGIVRITVYSQGQFFVQTYPVYNTEPRDGKLAEVLFSAEPSFNLGANIPIVASLRSEGDYGISAVVRNIPTAFPLVGQQMTLWGVPWAASHDKYRVPAGFRGTFAPGAPGAGAGDILPGIPDEGLPGGSFETGRGAVYSTEPQPYQPSWGPIRPFTLLPSECGERPVVGVAIDSWQRPGEFADLDSPADAAVDGCGKVPFEPAIELDPGSNEADSPTGLDVELTVPQNDDPPEAVATDPDDETGAPAHWKSDAGIATSTLRDSVVTLPEGMAVNPAAAATQEACTSGQIGLTSPVGKTPPTFDSDDPSDDRGDECPDASKIGTVAIETPLLDEADWPTGEVYLAAQGDNPFGSLLAIYVVARSLERGLVIKLAGEVEVDSRSGQLTTTFAENPQLPFEVLRVRFRGGDRAPLATPAVCGTHTSRTELVPWARPGDPVSVLDPFEIDGSPAPGCPASEAERPFGLGLAAGSALPLAGAHAPFTMRLTRPDGAQEIERVDLTTPPGLSARLAGVPYCPEAALARAVGRDGRDEQRSPSCPPASRVGSTVVGAGAGPKPLYVDGALYLAGPYKGAPLSLAAVVPAVAGPFDLGVQVVRTALYVDPATARVTARTDSLPKLIEGIPLRLRDIRIALDRPGFALNPTSCAVHAVHARALGSHGAVADLASRFQLGNCGALGFEPKLAFRLKGGTGRGAHPALKAVLKARPGDANISRAAVSLPGSAFLDQGHIRTICTRVQFAQGACPPGSVYGHAKAWSPLLAQPLEGPVYLRSSDNNLPDMVAHLRGQISVEVAGRIDSVRGRIRNTFEVVPDAPVSRFALTLKGARKGLIVNSRNTCRGDNRALVRMRAHNGRRLTLRPPLANPKCKKQRKRAKAKRKAAQRKRRAAGRRAQGR
jgi:hypothetical protein